MMPETQSVQDLEIARLNAELYALRHNYDVIRQEVAELRITKAALEVQVQNESIETKLAKIMEAEVFSAMGKYIGSESFQNVLAQEIDKEVERYLQNSDIDVEEHVKSAIEESLQYVRVSFRR